MTAEVREMFGVLREQYGNTFTITAGEAQRICGMGSWNTLKKHVGVLPGGGVSLLDVAEYLCKRRKK